MSSKSFSFSDTSSETTELDYDYELSDNVVEDLVRYTRSRTVKNEQQFVLTTLGYISGFMESPNHYLPGVLIGTAGSGKSHVQNTIEELFPDNYLYKTTTGTDKSIIYDDAWEDAYTASLDELQKPGDEIIEILKSLHGGEDKEFTYKITGDGRGADREVDTIVRTAIPYWFLYAQMEPDFEMWDRLLKVPVHESSEKNKGVVFSQWDHSFIGFGEDDAEYLYDFEDGKKAIREHIRETPKDAWVKIPAGEEEFDGDNFVEYAYPIFDDDRSEVNRVSGMVANAVRSSALLNHENREVRQVKVRNEGVKNAIIAEPQDLANVLSSREVLLATTHQLDRRRRAICLAIQKSGGTQQAASIQKIQDFLRKTNASFVKRSQVEAMLDDLQDNYLVEKLENAGENGRHLYQFTSWSKLGKFEIDEDFEQFFEGCVDPFTGDDFVDTAKRLNEQLTPKVSDFMSDDAEITTSSEGGQATLMGTDAPAVEADLEPFEEAVRQALKKTLHGETLDGLDEHEPSIHEMIGVVPIGHEASEKDIEGTLLDPEHEVWSYGPDEWVKSRSDAEEQVERAVTNLASQGIFQTSVIKSRGGQPLSMKVTVRDV